jgi:hypothetical protein
MRIRLSRVATNLDVLSSLHKCLEGVRHAPTELMFMTYMNRHCGSLFLAMTVLLSALSESGETATPSHSITASGLWRLRLSDSIKCYFSFSYSIAVHTLTAFVLEISVAHFEVRQVYLVSAVQKQCSLGRIQARDIIVKFVCRDPICCGQ